MMNSDSWTSINVNKFVTFLVLLMHYAQSHAFSDVMFLNGCRNKENSWVFCVWLMSKESKNVYASVYSIVVFA